MKKGVKIQSDDYRKEEEKMAKYHSDPKPHEVWIQKGKIINEEKTKITLAVNDEHGMFSKRDFFSPADFKKLFKKDPREEGVYVRSVVIIETDSAVLFQSLDAKDAPINNSRKVTLAVFRETYIYSHDHPNPNSVI